MIDEIDIEALRHSVAAARRWRLTELAERIGISNQALFLFSIGTVTLPPTVLRRLAELIAPGAREAR